MRAIVQDGYGSAEVLRPAERPRPQFKDGQVLVQVRAAGLDRGTWHLMHGKPYAVRLALGLRRLRQPVPGLDLSGTVAEVGPQVSGFAVGDEVYGVGIGSFAEYAAAKPGKLAPKPANLTFEQAAVVPVSGLTALQALTTVGHLEAGQRVLVTGASGGVGSYAVQLAKALGAAHVTGECGTAKVDLVRSLGADEVLDYRSDDWGDGTRHFDLIVDIAGSPSVSRLRRALTPNGTVAIVGGEGGGNLLGVGRAVRASLLSPFVRQRLAMFVSKERAEDLVRLTELIEAGQVTPSVGQVFPLQKAADAMRHFEAGDARGKIAISVAG